MQNCITSSMTSKFNIISLFKDELEQELSSPSKYCVSYEDIKGAHDLIKPYIRNTLLITCSAIDRLCGRNVFMKTENFQETGSIKFRGTINAIALLLHDGVHPDCLVTVSSGNHGIGLAKAAEMLGKSITLYVVVPHNCPEIKKQAIKDHGGIVVVSGVTKQAIMDDVENICKENCATFMRADHIVEILAGYGTVALEMLEENPDLDIIVAPVGTGGMISGIAVAAKHIKPSIKIYAVEPEEADDCYLSKLNNRLTPLKHPPNTIADGLGSLQVGPIAWPIIRDLVDDVITVTEDEIKRATKLVWEKAKLVIEPSAGVAIAGIIGEKFSVAVGNRNELKNVGVVLSGGNVDIAEISKMLDGI